MDLARNAPRLPLYFNAVIGWSLRVCLGAKSLNNGMLTDVNFFALASRSPRARLKYAENYACSDIMQQRQQVAQAPLGTVNITLSNSVTIRVCMGI